ncbi:hypothetical protein, partial [Klebsiella pneumoniae]|uniref:hypothetical protein n=1 Tax=Klebsiella pneumoniae TaxID=573 RepID=UPI001954C3F2
GRKRVKDQLLRIDSTYPDTDFSFTGRDGRKVSVTTLEQTEYPDHYHKRAPGHEDPTPSEGISTTTSAPAASAAPVTPGGKAVPLV